MQRMLVPQTIRRPFTFVLIAAASLVSAVVSARAHAQVEGDPGREPPEAEQRTDQKTEQKQPATEGTDSSSSSNKPTDQSNTGAAPAESTNDDAREHLTAADVLKALQRQRPEQRIIAPEGKTLHPADARRSKLLPEGYPLVDIGGVIDWQSPWWVFHPETESNLPPMKLLPNAILEPMARSAGKEGNGHSAFSLYGSVTEFAGENYSFAQFVAQRETTRPTAAAQVVPQLPDSVAPGGTRQRQGAKSEPGAGKRNADGDVDDIMKALQEQRPTVDPLSIVAVTPAHDPSQSDEARPPILPEGEPVSARLGRLIRAGEWWTLVFESETDKKGELPLRLLPNRNLQRMVEHNVDDTSGSLYLVSGRITIFEGENYLLTRSAQQPVTSDNLRK